jgi:hypothetical protein
MGLGELAVPLGGGAVSAGEDHQGGSRRAVGGLISRYWLGSIPSTSRSTSCWSQAAMVPIPVPSNNCSEAIHGRVVAKLAGQNTSNARAPRSSRTVVSRIWSSPCPACIASQ